MTALRQVRCAAVLCSVALIGALVTTAESARILGFFPTPSKSHLIVHCAIAAALAEAGHDVTVIAPTANVYPAARYRYIQVAPPAADPASFALQMIHQPIPTYRRFGKILSLALQAANETLSGMTVQQYLHDHRQSVDLVILGYFMNDFHLGLAAHFHCPIVVSFTVRPILSVNALLGNPGEVAYVPALFSRLQQPLHFADRLKNYLYALFERYVMGELLEYNSAKHYNYHFPSDRYPSFEEAKKNISLVLTNHHFSQGPIRPNVPAIIEIGGIQIKEKPDPLPVDIAALLNNAKNGAIYFSFGTNVQGSILSKEKAKIMFDVLSKLPYMVLWKWGDTNFPGTAPNIIYKSWLPQDDILAHPNVKLFITHGGQGSVVESQYHGVPMVGIPLFGDQPANMASVVNSGFGVRLDYLTLTHEDFERAILEVIGNPKYTEAVKRFSAIYRDRPMSPRQTAVYWIEYVLRHKGAKHLQSPALQMNTFQLLSLDVIGFLALVLAVIVGAIVKVFQLIGPRKPKKVQTVTKSRKNK